MSSNLMCAEAAFEKSLMRCAGDLIAKDFVLGTLDSLGNIYQGQGEDRRLHETQDPGDGSSSRVCRGLIAKLRKSAVNMTDAKSQPTSAMEVAGCNHVTYSKRNNCIDILDEALFKVISRNATSAYRQGVAFFLSDSLWSYTVSEGSRRGLITTNPRSSRHDDMYLYRDCGFFYNSGLDDDYACVIDLNVTKLRTASRDLFIAKRRRSELVGVFSGNWEWSPDGICKISRKPSAQATASPPF